MRLIQVTDLKEKNTKKTGLHVVKVVSVRRKSVTNRERFKRLQAQYDASLEEQEATLNESQNIVNAVYG